MINVLDHGYVKLIESWGSDERIIEAARQSTQKGFNGWGDAEKPGDEKLLRYLWENDHSTPFEFAGAVFEVQAPMFVVREWQRHRTQSFSEASARYAPLPELNYVPSVERLMQDGGANKQAGPTRDSAPLTEERAWAFIAALLVDYECTEGTYKRALREGVPKELARLVLPSGRYTRMRVSANLRNWLGFLKLRMASNAQWEIVQYANAVHSFLSERFPRTLELFDEGRGQHD